MKGVFLCTQSKQCNYCGAKLEMKRKEIEWVEQGFDRRISRPTTVFTCRHCSADYMIRGDHIDSSGWRELRVLLRDDSVDPPHGRSSEVHTYYDPSVKRQEPKPSTSGPVRQENGLPVGPRDQVSPRRSKTEPKDPVQIARSPKRSCGVCEFWNPRDERCAIYSRKTKPGQWCKRFRRNWITVYKGGGMSPR